MALDSTDPTTAPDEGGESAHDADARGAGRREERTDTAQTDVGPEVADDDVTSDPALDDRLGSDWADEGGATTAGPATTAPGGAGAAEGDDPKRRADRAEQEEG